MIPHMLNETVATVAPAIANHLWQSTLFAAVAAALTLVLRKNQARARYWLWMAASVKFLAPFSLLVDLGAHFAKPQYSPAPQDAAYFAVREAGLSFANQIAPAVSPVATSTNFMSITQMLPLLVGLVWLSGFLAALALWCIRWRRIAAAMRNAIEVGEGRELEALRRLETAGGLRTRIALRLSAAAMEPGIFGITRPVLAWPECISARLDDAHLEAILAHEVCHVRRRDNLTAAIHMFVEAAFWFHPMLWWMGARLVEERERACDEEVLELCAQPEIYAQSILKVCEFCVESPLACVSGVTGADLKKRIVQIMTDRVARRLNFGRKALLATVALAAIAGPILFGLVRLMPMYGQILHATGPLPSFEVATIKPSKPDAPGKGYRIEGRHFGTLNTTASDLIQYGYGVQARLIINAPAWLDTDKYDIVAVAGDSDSAKPNWNLMVQRLLTERFGLTVHPDSRELPVYELHIAKNGPKLTKHKGEPGNRDLYISGAKSGVGRTLHAKATTMAAMASALQVLFDRPVVDRTGLTGEFDFEMEFAGSNRKGASSAPTLIEEPDGPASIFTAIQEELGLKLEAAKGQAAVVVIDHVAKPELDNAETPQPAPATIKPVSLVQEKSVDPAAKVIAFDVASIKLDRSNSGALMFENKPDGLQARGFTVQMLIRAAYGYDDALVFGAPGWLNSEHYTLDAKVAGSDMAMLAKYSLEQRRQMLRPLLAERFHLKFHRETKQLPIYSLVLAQGGLKMTPSPPRGTTESEIQMKLGHLDCLNFPLSELKQWLTLHVGREVVDNTRLTGRYDFNLHWTPDSPASTGAETVDAAPSLFTAIQEQLGLRLEAAKGPVETFVIDDIEKPSEN